MPLHHSIFRRKEMSCCCEQTSLDKNLGMWNKHSPGQKSFFTLTSRGWGNGPEGAEHSNCLSPHLTGFQRHRYNWTFRPRLTRPPCASPALSLWGPPLWCPRLTSHYYSPSPSPGPRAHHTLHGFCSCAGLGMCLQTQVRAPGRFPSSVSSLPALQSLERAFLSHLVFQLFTGRKWICYPMEWNGNLIYGFAHWK